MMRISKDPEERRNEILDVSEALFYTKGYEKTTINDILNEIGIAKGTFYYYFKSKEEVMDAIVVRIVDKGVQQARAIAAAPGLGVHEKFLAIMLAQKPGTPEREHLIHELHHINNALLHQKSLSETVKRLTPVLEEVLEEGKQQGIFDAPYPRESIELLLTGAVTLFDDGIFQWEPREMGRRVEGFIYAAEMLLGAGRGSLAYMSGLFEEERDTDGE